MTTRPLGPKARLYIANADGSEDKATAIELSVEGMSGLSVQDNRPSVPRPHPGYDRQIRGPVSDRITTCAVHATTRTAPLFGGTPGMRRRVWLAPEGEPAEAHALEAWDAYIRWSAALPAEAAACSFNLTLDGDSAVSESAPAGEVEAQEGGDSYLGNNTNIWIASGKSGIAEISPDAGAVTLNFLAQAFNAQATLGRTYRQRTPIATAGAVEFGFWNYGVTAKYAGDAAASEADADNTRMFVATPWGVYAMDVLFSGVTRTFPFADVAAFAGPAAITGPVAFADIDHGVASVVKAAADVPVARPGAYVNGRVWVRTDGAANETATAQLVNAGGDASSPFPLARGLYEITDAPDRVSAIKPSKAPGGDTSVYTHFGQWARGWAA